MIKSLFRSPRRKEYGNRKLKLNTRLFGIFIILVGIVIAFGILRSNIFTVSHSAWQMDNVSCVSQEELERILQIKEENIIFINQDDLNKKIKKFNCIKGIQLDKKYPNSILFKVVGRIALARVYPIVNDSETLLEQLKEATPSSTAALLNWSIPADSTAEGVLIDETGYLFTKDKDIPLPTLFLAETPIEVGHQISHDLINKLALIIKDWIKPEINLPFSNGFKVKIIGSTVMIFSQPKVVLSLNKDVSRQLISLQLILQKAKIDERELEIIDLRFDRAVIRYIPKK